MSKTIATPPRPLWAYREFFELIMVGNGWEITSPEDSNEDLNLRLSAIRKVSRGKDVKLTLTAWRKEGENIMYLSDFRVSYTGLKSVPVLGKMLLQFYGKQLCDDTSFDLANKTTHWAIEKPVDLLALLEAYDRVASASKYFTILSKK